jgi:protein-tyrosine phosphatase
MAGLFKWVSDSWAKQFPKGFFLNDAAEVAIALENAEMAMPSLVEDEAGTRLFIGAIYCACNQPIIFKEKITTIITCTNDTRGFPSFNNTVKRLKENLGIQYATLTWKDDDEQTLSKDDLGGAIKFIHKQRQEGESVLVHCVMGKSRSAALVLGYMMAKEGIGLDEALEKLKACRDVAPRESFLRQLKELEDWLKSLKSEMQELKEVVGKEGVDVAVAGLERMK